MVVYLNNSRGIIGHPSISNLLVRLVRSGIQENIDIAAALYRLIEHLELDPEAKNTPWINVCDFKEFNGKAFIFYTMYRAKLHPFIKPKKETHYRTFFICEPEMGRNVYLYLGLKNYDKKLNTYEKNWKHNIFQRCWEFQISLKQKYLSGIVPLWRTP